MRMRKKAHLEERLEKCVESSRLLILNCEDRNFVTSVKTKEYLDLEALFGNKNPIVMEIGAGKGQFACELAGRYPNINILAVERTANVIVEAAEKGIALGLKNLMFLRCDAEYLEKFIPDGVVTRLYLNFSCPFPKKSYAAHRLTHHKFLRIYDKLLSPGAQIHQKTDNRKFFEFSINELSGYGFTLQNVCLDLHANEPEDNIMTEYEKRFTEMGKPIYRLEAYLKR